MTFRSMVLLVLLTAARHASGASTDGGSPRHEGRTKAIVTCPDLWHLARRHALRRSRDGADDATTRELAGLDPGVRSARGPVERAEAQRLVGALRTASACPLETATLIEYVLEDSPALPSLLAELVAMASDREATGEGRAACLVLALRAGQDAGWVPSLLTADVPRQLASQVWEIAEGEPSILPRVMARSLVLGDVSEDSHLRVDAKFFAYRHARDVDADLLMPVVLLAGLLGSSREPLALRRDWGPDTQALIDEMLQVHAEARERDRGRGIGR